MNLRTAFVCSLLPIALSGCASVSVSRQQWTTPPAPAPDRIFVTPFTLEHGKFRVDREGAELAAFKEKFSREFADRLAERLTKYVRPSTVIAKDEKIKDANAWLVSGHFVRVHQGSRALRALVGWGLGATKTETRVDIFQSNRQGRLSRIAQIETTGGSNAEPGAIFSGPFGAGPRLIASATMAGLAADARRTARTITAAISEKLAAQGAPLAGRPLHAKPLGRFPAEPAPGNVKKD
jgi:hypothetical protein